MRLIDADALLQRAVSHGWSTPKWVSNIVIEDAPTIEAEPIKHGRWKPFDLTWGRSIYACTNCGEAFEVPTEGGKPMYDYCPHCGARMDLTE